ncbi:MAG TPA: hypothetical protein PKE69_06810 [Pyrinomonadaceae bacterium]|nr:hypothetical protein [Pyrinomonadaceae bacterium]
MNDKKDKQYVFKFECAEVWETLTETESENIRQCGRCDKNVHFFQNHKEFIGNAERGNCVYSPAIRTTGIPVQSAEIIESQTAVKPKFAKRILQFIVIFFAALPIVSFLPLFFERTMIRSQVMGNGGDVIRYDWKIRTFYGFLSNYEYFRPEEYFSFLLAVNLILACVYAFIVAFIIFSLFTIIKRRK